MDDKARRIMIVDDHPLLRDALVQMIEQDDSLKVCGQAGSFREALERIDELNPDLVLVDLGLKDVGGLELLREISLKHPSTLALVLSMFDEFSYAPKALQAGARGYIMKTEPPQTVIQGIRSVLEGRTFVSEPLKDWLVSNISGGTKPAPLKPSVVEVLSKRELQVFSLIGEGLTTQAISKKLRISPKTVQTHREKIKAKLKLRTSADLGHRAFQWLHSKGDAE
jgi:DNA-binding NarL/FixJ family response regulator